MNAKANTELKTVESMESMELIIAVTGEVSASNFVVYKKHVLAQISSIKTDLKTDDDFADAKKVVNQLKSAEKSMFESKEAALKKAKDVYQLFDAIDEMSDAARNARLGLSKQIKAQEKALREGLINDAFGTCEKIYFGVSNDSPDFKLVRPLLFNKGEFEAAIKGKSSLKVMEKTLEELINEIEIKIAQKVKEISINRAIIDAVQGESKSLFQDEQGLLSMDEALLTSEIKGRIATAKANELERKQREDDLADKQSKVTETAGPVIEQQATNAGSRQIMQTHNGDERQTYLIQMQLMMERDDVVEFAQKLEAQFKDNKNVLKIKLGKGLIA